jgi:hypothetical protein
VRRGARLADPRRLPKTTLAALAAFVFLALFAPQAARAQDRRIEASAKQTLKRAHADFSAADYDGGLARLLKASRACGTIRCSAPTRAALLRDTGVMQLRRGNGAKAAQLFLEARKVDSHVDLVAPYDAPDIRAAWSGAPGATGGPEATVADTTPQPTGDFSHTPASEQAENTPVPVYVEYAGSDSVASVVVKYKGASDTDWQRLSLVRMGRGWGGVIPCSGARAGILHYYVQGFDSGGSPNALSGDPKRSFHVPIRHALVGQPPSLPGQVPPVTCAPGQEEAPVAPAEKAPAAGPLQCIDDSQCNGGVCTDGRCAEPEPERRDESRTTFAHFWFGLSLSLDIAWLPSGQDVCKLTSLATPLNPQGYYCTNPGDGSDFPSLQSPAQNNTLTQPGTAGQVSSGPAVGNVRFLGSFDYAFNPNWLLGARFGLVMHSYTGSGAVTQGKAFGPPIEAELRATYVLGKNALAHAGFSPLAFLEGGVARFDAVRDVNVTQAGIPGPLPKRAWRTGGPAFAGVGAGARYQFSQRIAFNAALKFTSAFGGNGLFWALGPEVALQYGF